MSYRWGTFEEYQEYAERMRGERHMTEREFIASMGETRTGDEHTDAHDAQWKWNGWKVTPEKQVVVDLSVWELTGSGGSVLHFDRRTR